MKSKELDKIIDLISAKISGTEFANHTFLVGGFVRDLLLGNERNDLDFVVSLPDGGVKLATFLYKKRVCYRPVVYKRFGTAMVLIKGHKVEFVMTRNESYQDKSRHPEVGFASLEEDAYRRDFTINALYYNISNKKIYDITKSGLSDLDNKLIRSTANPDIIFHEDPLRILRAIRFAGRLDFTIEADTLQGIIKWRDYLQHISVERIKDEFVNMILKKGFSKSLKLCFETGVMAYILSPLKIKQTEVLSLVENIDLYPEDLTIRLALIAIPVEDTAEMEKAIFRLRINQKLTKKAMKIASNVQKLLQINKINKLNDFVFHNLETLPFALEILKLNYPEFHNTQLIQDKINLFESNYYPLNGKEVIKALRLRNNQDKAFYIKEAKKVWIENPLLDKQEIIAIIKAK